VQVDLRDKAALEEIFAAQRYLHMLWVFCFQIRISCLHLVILQLVVLAGLCYARRYQSGGFLVWTRPTASLFLVQLSIPQMAGVPNCCLID
jgi:hypothetical protein